MLLVLASRKWHLSRQLCYYTSSISFVKKMHLEAFHTLFVFLDPFNTIVMLLFKGKWVAIRQRGTKSDGLVNCLIIARKGFIFINWIWSQRKLIYIQCAIMVWSVTLSNWRVLSRFFLFFLRASNIWWLKCIELWKKNKTPNPSDKSLTINPVHENGKGENNEY